MVLWLGLKRVKKKMEATGWVVVGENQGMKLKSLKKIKPEVMRDLRLS